MGVAGDTFNEGFKFMCKPLYFYQEGTGTRQSTHAITGQKHLKSMPQLLRTTLGMLRRRLQHCGRGSGLLQDGWRAHGQPGILTLVWPQAVLMAGVACAR